MTLIVLLTNTQLRSVLIWIWTQATGSGSCSKPTHTHASDLYYWNNQFNFKGYKVIEINENVHKSTWKSQSLTWRMRATSFSLKSCICYVLIKRRCVGIVLKKRQTSSLAELIWKRIVSQNKKPTCHDILYIWNIMSSCGLIHFYNLIPG